MARKIYLDIYIYVQFFFFLPECIYVYIKTEEARKPIFSFFDRFFFFDCVSMCVFWGGVSFIR